MSDAQSRRSSGEASVGDQCAFLAEVSALDIRGGVEHLLHTRASLWSLVGNYHAVARLHLSAEYSLASVLLRVEAHGRTLEMPQRLVHAGRLHHASVFGDVAEEHGKSAVLRVGMFQTAYAAPGAVGVEALPLGVLTAHLRGELVSRRAAVDAVGLRVNVSPGDVVFLHLLRYGLAVHALALPVDKSALVQFVHNAENTSGAVALLHTVFLRVRREHTEARHLAAQSVDVLHLEISPCLLRHGEQMQHGVCAAAHCDVERHGVEESLACGDAARQNALVAVLVISQRVLHHQPRRVLEQSHAVLVRGEYRAVSRQTETNGLRQRVHRIGGEHARATAAAGTGALFELPHVVVGNRRVGALYHRRHEVGVLAFPLAGLHGAAGAEHRGDVEPHCRHQHSGRHLVAVGNADHRVRLVGVHHVFHGVGDDVAAWQRIEHTVVSHGDAVVHGNGVELGGIAPHGLYFLFHYLPYFVQMRVSGNKLREAVYYGYDRFAELLVFHTGGHPQGACSRHSSAFRADATSQLVFHIVSFIWRVVLHTRVVTNPCHCLIRQYLIIYIIYPKTDARGGGAVGRCRAKCRIGLQSYLFLRKKGQNERFIFLFNVG